MKEDIIVRPSPIRQTLGIRYLQVEPGRVPTLTRTFSNLTPHSLKVFLRYRHPPVVDRIRAIRNRPSLSSAAP